MRLWTCEWGGMAADIEAETRGKARYKAYRVLRETYGLRNLTEIRVTVSLGIHPLCIA